MSDVLINRYNTTALLNSSLISILNVDIIFKKMKIESVYEIFYNGKINLTGSSGRINGIKLQRIKHLGISQCNIVPRVLSYLASLSRHGGRVGEDPGNEVVQNVAHVGHINGVAALSGFSKNCVLLDLLVSAS